MAERDPFGRLPGEDTLAGLGSLGDGVVPPSSAETVQAEPSEPDAGTGAAAWGQPTAPPEREPSTGAPHERGPSTGAGERQPPARASRPAAARRSSRIVRGVVLAIAAVVGLNVVAALLIDTATVEQSSEPAVATKAPDARDVPASDAPAPVGLQERSLLLRGNLAPALQRLRTSGLGRLYSLRLAPERIDAQLLTKSGRLRFVQLRHDGELRRLSLSGPGFNRLQTIPFARVDASAPARLARSAAGRSRRPVSQVNYLVFSNVITSGWSVYMKSGASFRGDVRGAIVRRTS